MSTFDPFTATLAEARAQPDAHNDDFDWTGARVHGAVRRWEAAQVITAQRAYLAANPIDGVAHCLAEGLVAPAWLAASFLQQYQMVTRAKVGTWDEAFGPAKPKNVHLSTIRMRAEYGFELRALFSGDNALPRTLAGRRQAAELLGITEKMVRDLMLTETPPLRANAKGHKAYGAKNGPALRANDPFSLIGKRSTQNAATLGTL
jgi:hypothetical protein